MMNRNKGRGATPLDQHKKSDKAKWIGVTVALLLIVGVIAAVAGLTNGFGLANKDDVASVSYKELAKGDKITAWSVDFDADVDYAALIKDVEPTLLDESDGMIFNSYDILTFNVEDRESVIFRVYEMKSVETGTSSYSLVIDSGEPNDDRFFNGIHFSDLGWISPSLDSDMAYYLVAVTQEFYLSQENVTVSAIANADVIAQFMGIERA